MKYLVIYDSDEAEVNLMEVWDFKNDDLANFMEDSWDRGTNPPIVIPVKDVKKVLNSKKGIRIYRKEYSECDEDYSKYEGDKD